MSCPWVSLVGVVVGGWHVVDGLRGKDAGAVQLGILDGLMLRGKWLRWRIRFAGGVIVLATVLIANAISWIARPPWSTPFAISIPPGWVDLSETAPASNAEQLGLPADALRARAKGTVAAAGIIEEGRVALFEARVLQGRWDATLERLQGTAVTNTKGMEEMMGAKPEFSDYALVEIQGVLSGTYRATLRLPTGTLHYVTYVLPAADSRAHLSLGADDRDLDKLLPAFKEVVEHARTPGSVFIPPFPPDYLIITGVLVDGLATLVLSTREPPASPGAGLSAAEPRRKRGRRKKRKTADVADPSPP